MIVFLFLLILALLATLNENRRMDDSFWIMDGDRKILMSSNVPIFTVCLLFVMYFLCATRDVSVGTDTVHYYYSFFFGTSRQLDPSFYFIKEIAIFLGNSFQQFLNIYALAAFIPLFLFFAKNSSNVAFSLLIYLSFSNFFYAETFNTIRVSAAISFFLLSLSFLYEKRTMIGVMLSFIAIFFHNSSIIAYLITLLILYIPKISKKITIIVIFLSLCCGLFFSFGFKDYAESLSDKLIIFSEHYSRSFAYLKETNFNFTGLIVKLLPFSILCIFLHTEDNSKNIFYKLFFASTVLSNFFVSVALIYRITMFFSVLVTIILPNTIKETKNNQRNFLFVITGTIVLLFCLRILFANDSMAGIIPYKSCITF